MSKYSPLEKFLKANANKDTIPMSFMEIEQVLGFKLPESSRKYRAWWSNNSSNNVMTESWLNAGFETQNVDMQSRKLSFRRFKSNSIQKKSPFSIILNLKPNDSNQKVEKPLLNETTEPGTPQKHPIFGALKDYFIIPPDLDLTEPLWEEGASYDDFA